MTESLPERLQAMTDGEGPPSWLKPSILPATFKACVEEVCLPGRIVFIGYAKAPVEYETKYFVMKELDIRGSRNAMQMTSKPLSLTSNAVPFPATQSLPEQCPWIKHPPALADWHASLGVITKIHVKL